MAPIPPVIEGLLSTQLGRVLLLAAIAIIGLGVLQFIINMAFNLLKKILAVVIIIILILIFLTVTGVDIPLLFL